MLRAALIIWLCACLAACARMPSYDVTEKSIADLQADLSSGAVTSEALVQAYLQRIETIDRAGPTLQSVIVTNPDALSIARALDAERRAGHVRGPLHGVPILLKDNIETADPMATTGGSLALADNITRRDAPLVARLREAGVIILGKTNLSEWANFRSGASISGWSAVGGLVRNPYALDRNACGSSSGSGAAAAASLAAATIGTETDGSITCPASVNGLVGIKPTVGLVSRRFIIPISHTQDTAGPMGRSVRDVAALLTVMAGSDPEDPATAQADAHRADYLAALDANALQGKRFSVLRFQAGYHAGVDARFAEAITALRGAGAEIIEIDSFPHMDEINAAELTILLTEFRADLNLYLATTPPTVTARTLADLIRFNTQTPAELVLFGQDVFEKADATHGLDDPGYLRARETARRLAGPEGIDRLLRETHADALIAPTLSAAWVTDVVNGDHFLGGATTLSAVSGYPHVTVPMGEVGGLPVGLSFMGAAWSEAKLLSFAYAYEQRTYLRRPPTYAATIAANAPFAAALRPAPQSH